MLNGAPGAGIEAWPCLLLLDQFDQRLQRCGCFGVQRDAALAVALTDRDAQAGMAVRVGVEAVCGQSADLVASRAAPTRHDNAVRWHMGRRVRRLRPSGLPARGLG